MRSGVRTRFYLPSVAIIALLFIVQVPFAHAENGAPFTWGNHSFATMEELTAYLQDYLAVWRELHGETTSETESTGTSANTRKAGFDVDTRYVRDVEHDGATLLGRLDVRRSEVVQVWFEYGVRSNYLQLKTEVETIDEDYGSNTFDRKIRLLEHDSKYYYRAVGRDESGARVYGDVKTFTTDADPSNTDSEIRIRTSWASDIKDNRATIQGTVNYNDSPFARVWFEYGDDEYVDYRSSKIIVTEEGSGRSFSRTLRKLDSNTAYYFRAVGEDSNGIKNFGPVRKFTTKRESRVESPEVSLERASDISYHTATLRGDVDMNSERNGIVFFIYGEDKDALDEVKEEYTRYSRIREDGDNLQKVLVDEDLDTYDDYKVELQNLDLGTKHYYAIGVEYENDDDEIILSSVKYFTTKDL